jgi:hypothetical protein
MSTRGLIRVLGALVALGGDVPVLGCPWRYPSLPAPLPGPQAVACPRCKAAPGQRCDHRTLRRHAYHLARVQALAGAGRIWRPHKTPQVSALRESTPERSMNNLPGEGHKYSSLTQGTRL